MGDLPCDINIRRETGKSRLRMWAGRVWKFGRVGHTNVWREAFRENWREKEDNRKMRPKAYVRKCFVRKASTLCEARNTASSQCNNYHSCQPWKHERNKTPQGFSVAKPPRSYLDCIHAFPVSPSGLRSVHLISTLNNGTHWWFCHCLTNAKIAVSASSTANHEILQSENSSSMG